MVDDLAVILSEGVRKPYSCPRGFYLRSGPNSQKLERDSIVEFFQSEGRVRYDEIIREDLPVSEYFNEAAYTRYIKVSKISDVLERNDILRGLGCARVLSGGLCFTNAGALFFRVNDKDILFRHAEIVCALYKGMDKAYILDAKELSGDLISNIDDAMVFLKKHLRLSYKIEGLRRENILELPEEALREAVVNAVCHRDYFEKGSRVMVEIYDDRVDIVNPGGVCKGVTRDNFGTISITRNAVIASMLYRFGYIEQMGTGVMRMKNAALDARVPEPEFELSGLFFRATFRRNAVAAPIGGGAAPIGGGAVPIGGEVVPIGGEAVPIGGGAVPIGGQESTPWGDRRSAVISFLSEHKQATISDLASIIALSSGHARVLLREMVSDGTIEKVGNYRHTYYILKRESV